MIDLVRSAAEFQSDNELRSICLFYRQIDRTLNFAASWGTADVCGFYRYLPSDD